MVLVHLYNKNDCKSLKMHQCEHSLLASYASHKTKVHFILCFIYKYKNTRFAPFGIYSIHKNIQRLEEKLNILESIISFAITQFKCL